MVTLVVVGQLVQASSVLNILGIVASEHKVVKTTLRHILLVK